MKYEDFPYLEVAARADKMIAAGADVFFKWTCVGCGSRQTFDTPNVLYLRGKCEECGTITDIEQTGCNYLLVTTRKKSPTKGDT